MGVRWIGEVGGVRAEVTQKQSSYERTRRQEACKQPELSGAVVARHRHRCDQAGEHYQHYGDSAVEAPGLGVGPGVERAHDLAALVRVGAALFERAAVARVCPSAVARESPLVVELVEAQILALGADPDVVIGLVFEPGCAVAQGAPVGVRREPFERPGAHEQGDRVAPASSVSALM